MFIAQQIDRRMAVLLVGALVVLAAGFFYAFSVHAEEAGADDVSEGIVFPIPELGNCVSKQSCKAYCEDRDHMQACIAFAEKHGLMSDEEVARARRFSDELSSSSGPGGCDSPRACQLFCEDVRNITACLSYAKKHNIRDARVENGEKIQKYLALGGAMPGGCTSEESCRAYCNDFAHAEECLVFTRAVGVNGGGGEGRITGDFEKFFELTKRGETPGGCASRVTCEAYCRVAEHRDECLRFAKSAGLISDDEETRFHTWEGAGPGGCDSPLSCKVYCDNAEHREECFAFAETHGLLAPDALEHVKDGLVQIRAGLSHAPLGVKECLAASVGKNILEDIQAGALTPGPEIGERMRSCFERFGHDEDSGSLLKTAPREVLACIRETNGEALKRVELGSERMTPELADVMRRCAAAASVGDATRAPVGAPAGEMNSLRGMEWKDFSSIPTDVRECVKGAVDADQFARLEKGEELPGIFEEVIRRCMIKIRGMEMLQQRPGGMSPGMLVPPKEFLQGVPSPHTGEEVPAKIFERLEGGVIPPANDPLDIQATEPSELQSSIIGTVIVPILQFFFGIH